MEHVLRAKLSLSFLGFVPQSPRFCCSARQETAALIQQVKPAQLLERTPVTENLIWFLEIFAGNIEPEQRIKFAPVQMQFTVIWAEWVSLPMHLYISPLIILVDFI